jgi:hypothetical protein
MPIQNAEIAASLDQTAELLEIEGANPFRVRVSRRAARMIEGCRSAPPASSRREVFGTARRRQASRPAASLGWMRFGVDQARRAWIEAKDVINTRSLVQLRKLLTR